MDNNGRAEMNRWAEGWIGHLNLNNERVRDRDGGGRGSDDREGRWIGVLLPAQARARRKKGAGEGTAEAQGTFGPWTTGAGVPDTVGVCTPLKRACLKSSRRAGKQKKQNTKKKKRPWARASLSFLGPSLLSFLLSFRLLHPSIHSAPSFILSGRLHLHCVDPALHDLPHSPFRVYSDTQPTTFDLSPRHRSYSRQPLHHI